MKYKKHLATGVLAISMLVSGSNVFAVTPQDLGIKNSQQVYYKQNKNSKIKKNVAKSSTVGTILSINNTGFTLNVKNIKAKTTSSIDVATNENTTYQKNGTSADASTLSSGQKVIVTGSLDKTTNIITAKTVKIATTS